MSLSLWACDSGSLAATSGSALGAAGAGVQAGAAAGGNAAGSSALPAADKCPQLPAAQGFRFGTCCQADNTCGVDASSLNRGCMSYAAFKMYFHFNAPPATTCDGVPIATAPGAAGAGATQ